LTELFSSSGAHDDTDVVVDSVDTPADDTDAAVALWAFLHGFITLERAGLFGTPGPKGGFARGVKAMAAGLRRPTSGGPPAIADPVS
jgi:hypothetical protein